MNVNYRELAWLASAEIVLVVTALVVLGVDLGSRVRAALGVRQMRAVMLGIGGCLVSALVLLVFAPDGEAAGGMLRGDSLSRWVKIVLLLLTAGTLLLSVRVEFTPHPAEYVAVVLLGAVGMLFTAGTENLLMLFLALELASLSLYILTAFDKRDPRGGEAALKYFLFGGMAGAFLLFGSSWIYGASGSIEFRSIGVALARGPATPVLWAGLVMMLVGLGFKMAVVPFHFWAPDAYRSAPAPVAGFIGGGSKVAAFFVFAKISLLALSPAGGSAVWGVWAPGWPLLVAWVAMASMVLGNLAALSQRNVKRLIAYSAVAQAGYTLVPVAAGGSGGLAAVIFYATTYALTVLGLFGVIAVVEARSGGAGFEHFAGLARRSPVLGLCFGVFVLSLAGIPPLAGFFGKLYLFLAALDAGDGSLGMLWLVGLGAATTCVAFYYYLRLLKVVLVDEPGPSSVALPSAGVEEWTVLAAALGVVAVGCSPGLLLDPLLRAVAAAGF